MYFWNTKALAQELSANTLKKHHYKNYYLIGALIVSAVYYLGMLSPYFDVRVTLVEAVLTLIIMAVGVQRTYQANGGDDGEYFLNRITALSLPILLQTTVAGLIFGIVLFFIYQSFNLEGTVFDFWYEWCVSAFTIFLQILFFTRLISYMTHVRSHTI